MADKKGVRLAGLDERDIKAIQDFSNYFFFLWRTHIIDCILKRQIYLYEEKGKIVALLLFGYKKRIHEHKIRNLLVQKEFRGFGIDKFLFQRFIQDNKPIKINIMATYSPENSVDFWKKMGFFEAGEFQTTKSGNVLLPMFWLDERLK